MLEVILNQKACGTKSTSCSLVVVVVSKMREFCLGEVYSNTDSMGDFRKLFFA